jgi:hypothetical protein
MCVCLVLFEFALSDMDLKRKAGVNNSYEFVCRTMGYHFINCIILPENH